jgi:hypothetical protein
MPAAFHFRLERVLRWRTLELTIEESKLKRLMDQKAQLDSARDLAQREISGLPARIASLSGLQGSDLNALGAYAARLHKEREKIEKRRMEVIRELHAQAEVHLKAKQRSRLLEELKTRKHEEWSTENNRELEALAQESYLARWEERNRAV